MEMLFWPLLGAVIGISAGMKRGFNLAGSALGGALLGPLAFLMFFMSGLVSRSEKRVKCPFCAEFVRPEALVCKHCHRDLTESPRATVPGAGRPSPALKTAVPRPDGKNLRCGNAACGRLLQNPTEPCSHCGTLPVRA